MENKTTSQIREQYLQKVYSINCARIPVSEECPIHNLFVKRKEIARELFKIDNSDDRIKNLTEILDYTEDKIKQYLWL